MRDYFAAARRLRAFLERIVHLVPEHDTPSVAPKNDDGGNNGIEAIQGMIMPATGIEPVSNSSAGAADGSIWASVRRRHPASADTLQRIPEHLHLVGPTFQSSDSCGPSFIAICGVLVQWARCCGRWRNAVCWARIFPSSRQFMALCATRIFTAIRWMNTRCVPWVRWLPCRR